MSKLLLAFCMWALLVSTVVAEDLIIKYNSVCFDRKVDGKFCCLAELPSGMVRSVCLNYDGTLHGYANRYVKMSDLVNTLSHPSTFPNCGVAVAHRYPRAAPCIDSHGNFRVGDKVMSPEEYFGNSK